MEYVPTRQTCGTLRRCLETNRSGTAGFDVLSLKSSCHGGPNERGAHSNVPNVSARMASDGKYLHFDIPDRTSRQYLTVNAQTGLIEHGQRG
ncbi:hypothetical protein PM082_014636 [Marasmius tenuissimus]|nr:hypothetical protein PM082_014636 [Marasmius tenuissimus]